MIERLPGEIPMLETRSESYEMVDKKKRYTQIFEVLAGGKTLTAKEIAVEMCNRGYIPTSERNFSSPRITELLRNGSLDCVGKKRCSYTGKTVSVFKLREEQATIYDYI